MGILEGPDRSSDEMSGPLHIYLPVPWIHRRRTSFLDAPPLSNYNITAELVGFGAARDIEIRGADERAEEDQGGSVQTRRDGGRGPAGNLRTGATSQVGRYVV